MKKTIILLITIGLLGCTLLKKSMAEDYLWPYTEYNENLDCVLYGYKTQQGEIAIKAKYPMVYTKIFYAMAFVFLDGKWVVIDRNENILLYPFIYDNGPDYVEEGVFRFVENDKIGFANMNGEKVIPAIFDFVGSFSGGIAEYSLSGYQIYIVGGFGFPWWRTVQYETGYVNHSAQLFSKVTELKNGIREAWTKDNQHVLLNEAGEIINIEKLLSGIDKNFLSVDVRP
ncbi:MAG: WG repeat-containing protein [Enterobacteriaceae bacterium]|nr:WG repeat-containing protein [Enterobacteriaceae bacterium]